MMTPKNSYSVAEATKQIDGYCAYRPGCHRGNSTQAHEYDAAAIDVIVGQSNLRSIT